MTLINHMEPYGWWSTGTSDYRNFGAKMIGISTAFIIFNNLTEQSYLDSYQAEKGSWQGDSCISKVFDMLSVIEE